MARVSPSRARTYGIISIYSSLSKTAAIVLISSKNICTYMNSSETTDRIHKWQLCNYSFVFMLIILTSLVSTNKIQKNFCFEVRLVRMINTKTKE